MRSNGNRRELRKTFFKSAELKPVVVIALIYRPEMFIFFGCRETPMAIINEPTIQSDAACYKSMFSTFGLYGALQHQCEVWNRNHATLQKYAENIRH
jgi:hypothetical protein